VLRCENPERGFSAKPNTKTQFIEHTCYDVETLSMLGEEPQYPDSHAELACTCQNRSRAFRRSPVLGTSTLENTHYVAQVLERLGYL